MLLFCAVGGNSPSKHSIQPKFDESLIRRIGEEDQDALEELYIKTGRAVYSFVLSIVRNPADTQDIVQETYLKIRAAAHLYQPMGKPLAWIFTIARNLARTKLAQGNLLLSAEDCKIEEDPQYSYISDPDDKMVLESALKILSQEERQVILLHCVAGMKHRELASNLGQPLSTVLSRYNRALKKLKKHLLEQGVL